MCCRERKPAPGDLRYWRGVRRRRICQRCREQHRRSRLGTGSQLQADLAWTVLVSRLGLARADPRRWHPPKTLAVTPPSPRKPLPHTYFCRDWPRFMTELLQSNVSSVTPGAVHELGMAGAVKFPGLVKSAGLVVGSVDPGQRRKYRGLVLAVPPAPRTADWRSRRHVRHRAHARALCGLCFWLRIQVVPSARGCSTDLLVRHLAVERCRRPVGSNRGRGLLRGAMGDYPAPTGHDDGSRHHLERRVGDRAADPHRGMLLMACGADHPLLGQRHRKFDMGCCLLRRWDWPWPVAAGVRR